VGETYPAEDKFLNLEKQLNMELKADMEEPSPIRPEIHGLKAACAALIALDGLTPEECEAVASTARHLENLLPKPQGEMPAADPRPTDRAMMTTAQAIRLLELTHDSQLRSCKHERDALAK